MTVVDAIRVDNLTKRFGEVTAVAGLSFAVAPGELFGLIGPDGAGKTTTIRMLAGLLTPAGGDAWVAGRHTIREAAQLKDEIGYMSQRFGLYADLTVLENIQFYADLYDVPGGERAEKVGRLLEFSGLAPFGRRRAGNLSGGMKQKLGLACALVHTPRVLLLDEPTNGVDPVSRREFWRILHELQKEGTTILVSTAYLDEADRCSRVALLHEGRLLACDTPIGLRRLMRGVILELWTAVPRRAAKLLRERLPGLGVGLFGDRLHVVGEDPVALTESVRTALATAGLELLGSRQVEPTLEDIFISVLGGAGHP